MIDIIDVVITSTNSLFLLLLLLLLEMFKDGSPSAVTAFEEALHPDTIQNMNKFIHELVAKNLQCSIMYKN